MTDNLAKYYRESHSKIKARVGEILDVLHAQDYEHIVGSFHLFSEEKISHILVRKEDVVVDFFHSEPYEDWDEEGSLCIPIKFFNSVLDEEELIGWYDVQEANTNRAFKITEIREALIRSLALNLLDTSLYSMYVNTFNENVTEMAEYIYDKEMWR